MYQNRVGTIYILTNKANGKKYVGKTVKPFHFRWNEHLCQVKKDHPMLYIHKAIKKYGIDSFQIATMPCLAELLNDTERALVAHLGTRFPGGYNLTDGGDGISGWKHTAETRARMHEHALGKSGFWVGKLRSAETKKKISESLTGKTITLESRRKMSASRTGKKHTDNTRCKLSAIRKRLIKEGKIGKPKPPRYEGKYLYHLHNHGGENFIVDNLRKFCENCGVSYRTLYEITRHGQEGKYWGGFRTSKERTV